jgi:hypothetical protein
MVGGIPGHITKCGADLLFKPGQFFSIASVAHNSETRRDKFSHRGLADAGSGAGDYRNTLIFAGHIFFFLLDWLCVKKRMSNFDHRLIKMVTFRPYFNTFFAADDMLTVNYHGPPPRGLRF